MMLTLGQAAKEVKVSKTAISNAIKDGRLSAKKTEKGSYEIDPAELFRVYPPKQESEQEGLTTLDPQVDGESEGKGEVLSAQLSGQKALLDEKEKQIERLLREKEILEERLTESAEQQKRLTLLITDQRKQKEDRAGEWQKSLKGLESRIANQEKVASEHKEERQKILRQNQALKKALNEEKNKSFFQKLFG